MVTVEPTNSLLPRVINPDDASYQIFLDVSDRNPIRLSDEILQYPINTLTSCNASVYLNIFDIVSICLDCVFLWNQRSPKRSKKSVSKFLWDFNQTTKGLLPPSRKKSDKLQICPDHQSGHGATVSTSQSYPVITAECTSPKSSKGCCSSDGSGDLNFCRMKMSNHWIQQKIRSWG